MINSAIFFACMFSVGITYYITTSRFEREADEIRAAARQLADYTAELEVENESLRAACDESSWGPGYPSTARRSHLSVVK